MIDPPWPYRGPPSLAKRRNWRIAKDWSYPTMPVADIFALLDSSIFPQTAPNHSVFLWSIDRALIEGEAEMVRRGYRRHTRIIWDKGSGLAPAFTLRFTHEFLTWFFKGKLQPVAAEARGKSGTVMKAGHRQHSRKPDIAYSLVESLYPNAKRLDVFSREVRPGWDCWGNEIGKF